MLVFSKNPLCFALYFIINEAYLVDFLPIIQLFSYLQCEDLQLLEDIANTKTEILDNIKKKLI